MEAESRIITARIDWQGITLSVTHDPDSFDEGAYTVVAGYLPASLAAASIHVPRLAYPLSATQS